MNLKNLLNEVTFRNWEISFLSDHGIQLVRRKQFSRSYFYVGLATLVLGGIGVIVLFAGLFDYYLQKDELLFLSTDELNDENFTEKYYHLID